MVFVGFRVEIHSEVEDFYRFYLSRAKICLLGWSQVESKKSQASSEGPRSKKQTSPKLLSNEHDDQQTAFAQWNTQFPQQNHSKNH